MPFYHLRPNKFVDRRLFVNVLDGLSSTLTLPISTYQYIGFGSYLFDDFKLMHDTLSISSMISLEADQNTFKRAEFNCPYKCISLVNQKSTDFIAEFDPGEGHYIYWLDYTSPDEIGQQFCDFASLLNKGNLYDIIKITLNAHAPSLNGSNQDQSTLHADRLNTLKERIDEKYLPISISAEDMTSKKYPLTLFACLKKLIDTTLTPSKYDKRFFYPLLAIVYQDGQTMLTLTGIILSDDTLKPSLDDIIKRIGLIPFDWGKPAVINIPELSMQEIIALNKLLPHENARNTIIKNFPFFFNEPENQAESYVQFYKFYPNFQSIEL